MKYKVGDRVRIVTEKTGGGWNETGLAEEPESIHITRDGMVVHAVHKRGGIDRAAGTHGGG